VALDRDELMWMMQPLPVALVVNRTAREPMFVLGVSSTNEPEVTLTPSVMVSLVEPAGMLATRLCWTWRGPTSGGQSAHL
jgi:hypothetical protein